MLLWRLSLTARNDGMVDFDLEKAMFNELDGWREYGDIHKLELAFQCLTFHPWNIIQYILLRSGPDSTYYTKPKSAKQK